MHTSGKVTLSINYFVSVLVIKYKRRDEVSLSSFWRWIHASANLEIGNQNPEINGYLNLRGGIVYARLKYDSGVIRVIAKAGDVGPVIRVACENTDFQNVVVDELRNNVQRLLEQRFKHATYVAPEPAI